MDRRAFLSTSAGMAFLAAAFPAASEPARAGQKSKWFDSREELMRYLKAALPVPVRVKEMDLPYGIEQLVAEIDRFTTMSVGIWVGDCKVGACLRKNIDEVIGIVAPEEREKREGRERRGER